jgi:hypothetical protein
MGGRENKLQPGEGVNPSMIYLNNVRIFVNAIMYPHPAIHKKFVKKRRELQRKGVVLWHFHVYMYYSRI